MICFRSSLTLLHVFFVLLVSVDDFHAPLFGVRWEQHLVQPWIALVLVQELDELVDRDRVRLGTEKKATSCPITCKPIWMGSYHRVQ